MFPETIAEEEFRALMAERGGTLLSIASYLAKQQSVKTVLVRPLLGGLLSQSMQIEELLDAYGASNNRRWYRFRLLTATTKLFADVSYELLHIQHALPAYHLIPIEQDFVRATQQAIAFTGDVLFRAARHLLDQACQLGLAVPAYKRHAEVCSEHLPLGRLPRDRTMRKTGTVSKTVPMLATAFLNLAAESHLVHTASKAQPEEYASYIPESVSEESLRGLELRFHNLQSLYDTYVSETETEDIDTALPVLRGHISVVFHLLKTATAFAHYYERHLGSQSTDLSAHQEPLVNPETLLATLMNYSVNFASQYITCAQRLCQEMLRRYADLGQIEVPVPPYRGFHVRPATLISKLVLHYGSEMQMKLDDDSYDASSPLELFRANEKINAIKRRSLASEIIRIQLVPQEAAGRDIHSVVRDVVMTLAERGGLIIYEQPLNLPDEPQRKELRLIEQVVDWIARLQAVGKIDMVTGLRATFVGDKRVLADIKLLAEAGYGEDNFGNNIALPEKLAYLRR